MTYRTDPARAGVTVTPSDTVSFTQGTTVGLYVGGTGNVVAVMNGTAVTFLSVPAGLILPIQCTRVNATSTTATNMVALF